LLQAHVRTLNCSLAGALLLSFFRGRIMCPIAFILSAAALFNSITVKLHAGGVLLCWRC
jgi:hypothetical protein